MRERRALLVTITCVVFVFLFAPILVVIAYSFNSRDSIFVFGEPSLRWYRVLFEDQDALQSIWLSTWVALVVAVIAVAIGSFLALGLVRLRRRESAVPGALVTLVFVTPELATASALLVLFSSLAIQLSPLTIIISHVTFSIAYVVLVVRSRLATLDLTLEEAASDLGASRGRVLRLVVLPQMWPSIAASACLVFLLSFDDFVTSLFTSGVGVSPLPVRIYGMIRHGLTPEINAIGTLMTLISLTVLAAGVLIYIWRDRRARLADGR